MNRRYTQSARGPSADKAEPVSGLLSRIASVLQRSFRSVFVEGEISNFKRHGSGHWYFTLKDSEAQIRSVMWASNTRAVRFRPTDGMLVRVRGDLTVYAARGDVQLSIRSMEPAGEGELQKALAALARKLGAEGLFDPARKRPLPRFPQCVGLVTSGSGAAVRDMLTVLERRYPLARVVVCPVPVQGPQAAPAVAAAVRAFNRLPPEDPQRPDVLLVGRGGGSLEDLWAFNEEVTVRAVHASGIPVVSGVGHESDTTLIDMVADIRAATPSMAAELAVPDQTELLWAIRSAHERQFALLGQRMARARRLLDRSMRVREHSHPSRRVERGIATLADRLGRLEAGVSRHLERSRLLFEARRAAFEGHNPLRPLQKGFALVESAGRRIVRAEEVPESDPFTVRFQEGSVTVKRFRNGGDTDSLTPADA